MDNEIHDCVPITEQKNKLKNKTKIKIYEIKFVRARFTGGVSAVVPSSISLKESIITAIIIINKKPRKGLHVPPLEPFQSTLYVVTSRPVAAAGAGFQLF